MSNTNKQKIYSPEILKVRWRCVKKKSEMEEGDSEVG
jgi:hypothetical protein